MARLIGPDEASREVKAIVGRVFQSKAGRPAELWADEAATVPADVLTLDGAAIADSTVTIDSSSMLPLVQFPDGVDVVYGTCDGGPAWPMYARTDDRIDGKVDVSRSRVSVASHGAVGNNIVDDTAACQAAIDALPLGGGVVYFPTGTYQLSAALVLASGVALVGDGDVTIVIRQTSPNANCVEGVGLERVGLRNLQLVGPGSGTGHGLALTKGAGDHVSYVSVEDVTVTGFGGDGLNVENPIVSRLGRVAVQSCGGWGFNLYGQEGGSSGTSTSLAACYVNDCDTGGFRLFKMAYSSLDACAVDACPVGYRLEDDFNVALTGCGGEGNASCVEIDGGYGCAVLSFFLHGNAGSGVHVFGAAQAVTLVGVVEVEPAGAATVCLDIDAGCSSHVLNCSNQTANSIVGGTAFSIDSTGGVSSPSGGYFEGGITSGSGDVQCVTSSKGLVLADRSNGNRYRLKVAAGVLGVEVVV